jgi:hypothetical protein
MTAFRKLLNFARVKRARVLHSSTASWSLISITSAEFSVYLDELAATHVENMSEYATDLSIEGDYVIPEKSPESRLHVGDAAKLMDFVWSIRESRSPYKATAGNPNPWLIDEVDRLGTIYFGCLLVKYSEWERIRLQLYERVLELKALGVLPQ